MSSGQIWPSSKSAMSQSFLEVEAGTDVGAGMPTAAVAGDVFTSPSADSVLTPIRAASGPTLTVLIVKDYTGDRLNSALAAVLAREEGVPVEVGVVADNVPPVSFEPVQNDIVHGRWLSGVWVSEIS